MHLHGCANYRFIISHLRICANKCMLSGKHSHVFTYGPIRTIGTRISASIVLNAMPHFWSVCWIWNQINALRKKKFKVRKIWDQLNAVWNVYSKCLKRVHQHNFWCRLLTHFELKKNIHKVILIYRTLFLFNMYYIFFFNWK